ncbi:MAG: diguanylate cyclase [Thermoanaerobaculia bacterium]
MASLAELLDAFGAGLYLLFGAAHLDLWLRRRDRLGYLWLAGASSFALAVDITGFLLRRIEPASNTLLAAINQFAVAAATVCIYELVVSLGRRPTGGFARLLQLFALAVSPLPFYAGLPLPVAILACGLLLLGALARSFNTGRGGDPESRLVARGIFVLILFLLADLAMLLGWLPQVPDLALVGFIVLFVASARSLSNRFDRDYRELGELRRDLETRIEQRTLELQAANARLEEVSRTDALTGLLNRRGFLEMGEVEIERGRRSRKSFCVVMADADHFKRVNDLHGHAAGDIALQQLAKLLRGSLRGQDLVGRWGGEEFVLLLPETDTHGGTQVAESIRRSVALQPLEIGAVALPVTLSFGLAEHRLERSLESTLAHADAALYRAKAEGRDRVVAHRPVAVDSRRQ